jgi:hypothetical protein
MPVLESLRASVQSHSGQFMCSEIHNEKNIRTVNFRHIGVPPDSSLSVPNIQGLQDFFETYAELTLYFEEQSGEAAYFIASPLQWEELENDFRPWLNGIEEGEIEDYLPNWVNNCLVVGEIPRSGNYLLVPISGSEEGKVFEFEHDGFEFIELGASVPDFVAKTLDLDTYRLSNIASHLRFITPNENSQWWIKELRDNRGNIIRTEA